MALELIWLNGALGDTEEIARFIARDSPRYAEAMVRRFYEAVSNLPDFPRMGRIVPEREDERYREVIVRPYRIIYKVSDSQIEILAVIHGARMMEPAVGDRMPRRP